MPTHISSTSEPAIDFLGLANLENGLTGANPQNPLGIDQFPKIDLHDATGPTPRLLNLSPRSRVAQTRAHNGLKLLIVSAVTWLVLQNTSLLFAMGVGSAIRSDPSSLVRATQDFGVVVWFIATVGQLCVVGVFGGIGMMIHGYADLFLDKQTVFEQHIERQMTVIRSNIGSIQQAGGNAHMSETKSIVQSGTGIVGAMDSTVSNVSVVVGANLAESKAPDEAKELVRELAAKIDAIKLKVPDSKETKNLVSDVQSLSSEMAKPEPRKQWYELSLQGIKDAAEALGEIATPVIGIVTKLVALLAV